ncbi:unnamed protein product [Victoria cruziana]
MAGTSEALFDHLASILKQFVEKEEGLHPSPGTRALGFTFSFPMRQTSVSSGVLVKWAKGFAINDMDGKDVAGCLQEAMTRVGLDMTVVALVNDTVGTLALGHYHDNDTVAAIIIGTGTNACYVERTDAITKCQGLLSNSGSMVVNVEWGNFWSSHLPRTSYDKALDDESPNPAEQGFEKMISGMYLGDIVRRVILRMAQESDLFDAVDSRLNMAFSLRTPSMSAMHEDDSPELREVARIMEEHLGVSDTPLKVRRLIVRVCDIVTQRAARLAAAGIVGILRKIGRDGSGGVGARVKGDSRTRRTVVSVEGGLYESYSTFREYMHSAVDELLGKDVSQHVVLRLSEDGSGMGTALLAAARVNQ